METLDRAIGVTFHDPALREMALTHRSFAFERGLVVTNERLEFLGDSVLGLVVTD
ncbi:MAG TPA: ribonuclease III, partial [Actinomycetota bacterium]